MAIALRGSAAVPAGNPTTGFTVAIDAAVLTGDILFLPVVSRDSTAGSADVTCTDNDSGGNTWSLLGPSSDKKLWLFYKRATSGTASKTVTIAAAVGSSAGVLKAFSGGSTTASPPYTDATTEANLSGDETHAGVTPSQAGSMLCAFILNLDNDNAVTSLSFATLGATTMTEKLSTGGSDCAVAFGHVLQAGGPSATGNLTWAQTDGTTYTLVLAIPPEATAARRPTSTRVNQAVTRAAFH